MEIKELSFLENLSGNDNKTSVMDSVIGGHDDDHSYSYDFHGYFSHTIFDKLKDFDFDFGKIKIEVTKPKPKPEPEFTATTIATADAVSIGSEVGVPDSPFG